MSSRDITAPANEPADEQESPTTVRQATSPAETSGDLRSFVDDRQFNRRSPD